MILFHNKHTKHFDKKFSDIWGIANDENNTHEEAWTVFADNPAEFYNIILQFFKDHMVIRRLRDNPNKTANENKLLQRMYKAILYCEDAIRTKKEITNRDAEIFDYPKDEKDWNWGYMDALYHFYCSIEFDFDENLQVGHAWMVAQMLISLSYAIVSDDDNYTPMKYIKEYDYNIESLISIFG